MNEKKKRCCIRCNNPMNKKERVCKACGFKHMQKPPTLSEKWFPKKKE
jgi:ribosomal protein L37E